MTIGSRLKRVTLLPATLAASVVLFAAGGAYAHGHDRDDNDRPPLYGLGSSHNPIIYHPVHGPGSSHNPIVYNPPIVRDHRGSALQGDVRDHRGLNDAPGGVTVSGGGTVMRPPLHCGRYCGGEGYGGGRGGPGGFPGVVSDHRGQATGRNNGSIPCYGDLCF
jgi:hypothetical protein